MSFPGEAKFRHNEWHHMTYYPVMEDLWDDIICQFGSNNIRCVEREYAHPKVFLDQLRLLNILI